MSTTVSNSFREQWAAETYVALQQKSSHLRNAVRVEHPKGADTVHFRKLGTATTIRNKPRFEDLTPSNISHDKVSVVLETIRSVEWIDSLDELQTDQNLRQLYTEALTAAVSRDLDYYIVSKALASAGSTVSLSNTLNKAGLVAIDKAMNVAKVPTTDRYIVISAGAREDILSDTTLVSKDYVEKTIMETGFLPNYLGFNIIFMPDQSLLPVDSSGKHTCFAWHKNAVGLGLGQDINLEIERVAQKDLTQILVKMLVNAVAIDTSAIFKFEITD